MGIEATVGSNIRRIREDRRLTQEGLGKVSGVHRSYIGAIERAEVVIGVVNLEKLARALQITPGTLLAEDLVVSPPQPPPARVHGKSFLTMTRQCRNTPEAILGYLRRSGVEVIQ